MTFKAPTRPLSLVRTLRKYAVSAFVVCSFAVYAIHDRMLSTQDVTEASQARPPALTRELTLSPTVRSTSLPAAVPTSLPKATTALKPAAPRSRATPTPVPPPTAMPIQTPTPSNLVAAGYYHDGTYTGSVVDAYFGNVQVQAVIRAGHLADVTWLTYPSHRRTSVRINSQVMPMLTEEAIQVQNANVDIISGATLTSEAFVMSLQTALDTAKR